MNREILFRGKRVDNGEWVEGYLMVDGYGSHHIEVKNDLGIWESGYTVRLETVGQYIGRTDRHGTEVFEGDIFRLEIPGDKPAYGVVKYDDGKCRYIVEWVGKDLHGEIMLRLAQKRARVVGNIHDNPELLEVTDV